MTILKKPLAIISAFALTFFIINESFTYYIGLEKAKEESFKKDKLILNNLTSAQAKNVEILAELLAANENVIEGYLQNNPEIIKKHISPVWDRVRDKQLTYEIHFFKPPAISFVNFSNFKSIGKDVSSVRTDIEWITSSFKASSHALMCKTYAGYRATHPILDKNGTMLGGLSLGKKIDWIPQALKKKTTHDSFLVYEKDATNSLAKKYYENFVKDKEIVGNYILANKTINITADELKTIDFTKEIQDITIGKENYTIYSFPIIDFNKQTMGYVFTVTQLDEFNDKFLAQLFKSFIILFLSALVIFIATRRRITNLLNEIDFIKKITKEIKSKDFSSLDSELHSKQVYTPALVKLKNNVVYMGYELEKHYSTLERQVLEKTQEIEETQRDIIFSVGSIAESRSFETGQHVKRVAEYSKIFALHYGLSKEESEMLKEASPMHDIGKVAIPDAILNKPARFTEEERLVMNTHAQLGYDMLKGSKRELLQTAAIVALEHHEKWDGTGYPQGLKGENIHIFGRITAIADVFDALGSDRCYKDAWKDERIFQLFKDEKGKQFEPKLVDIFFKNLKEFLNIRDTFKDSEKQI